MTIAGYSDFGGRPDDVTADLLGNAVGGVVLTAWTALTGGSQITNLLTPAGTLWTDGRIISDPGNVNQYDLGRFAFQAPEQFQTVYLDRGYGERWPVSSRQSLSLIGTAISKSDQAYTASGEATAGLSEAQQNIAELQQMIADLNTAQAAQDARIEEVATEAGVGVNQRDGEPHPEDFGWVTWTVDPALITTGSVPISGALYLMRLRSREAKTITRLGLHVITAGAGLTNVGFAIYSAAGALLTSSVDTNGATVAAFQGTGAKAVTFTTGAPVNGEFYAGFWFAGTTAPSLARGASGGSTLNTGTVAPNLRHATADTGLVATPPANFGVQSNANAAYYVAAGE